MAVHPTTVTEYFPKILSATFASLAKCFQAWKNESEALQKLL
jgi:hypothetical protein